MLPRDVFVRNLAVFLNNGLVEKTPDGYAVTPLGKGMADTLMPGAYEDALGCKLRYLPQIYSDEEIDSMLLAFEIKMLTIYGPVGTLMLLLMWDKGEFKAENFFKGE